MDENTRATVASNLTAAYYSYRAASQSKAEAAVAANDGQHIAVQKIKGTYDLFLKSLPKT